MQYYVVNCVNDKTNYIGALHSKVEAHGKYNLKYIGIGGSIGRLSSGIDLIG